MTGLGLGWNCVHCRGGNIFVECRILNERIISEINAFWLGASLESPEAAAGRKDWWYKGGPTVDDEIRSRFGGFVEEACAGGLADWQATADGAFALVLLLDQFTRNIYRNTLHAYEGDARAFEVVTGAVERGSHAALHPVSRIWLYHPFHHSEDVHEQDRGMALLESLLDEAPPDWKPYVQRSIEGWTRHRDIVARFGRFPHRNAVLGRSSTTEEEEFLKSNGESFGQGPKPPAP